MYKAADIEHTARVANAIAELATTDEEQERVRTVCRNMARFKLAKFSVSFTCGSFPGGEQRKF